MPYESFFGRRCEKHNRRPSSYQTSALRHSDLAGVDGGGPWVPYYFPGSARRVIFVLAFEALSVDAVTLGIGINFPYEGNLTKYIFYWC